MFAPNVIDLSFAPGEQQDLADLPYEAEMVSNPAAQNALELNVSHAHVLVLTSAPEAPVSAVLQFVTVLHASHNDISSLRGVEAFTSLEVLDLSHNRLRMVDAHSAKLLKTLRRLRTVDFSHNHMNLLDLDGSYGAPSPRSMGQNGGGGSLASSLSYNAGGGRPGSSPSTTDPASGLVCLTAINLSHNAFIEMPDLRSAPFLQVLNISHNKLDDITDVEVRLPLLSLHSLLFHANQLPNATALVPLCALASTLKHLQVFNNPFTFVNSGAKDQIDVAQWWRPFLLFLCPLLATVDQTEFTSSERRVATRRLFREHGSLARSTVEYMNPQNKDALEAYLKRQGEAAEPPADALVVIKELEEEEAEVEHETALPSKEYEDAAQSEADEDEDTYTTDVVVPMSRMHTVREQGTLESSGTRTKGSPLTYYTDPQDYTTPPSANPATSTRTSTRVVIVDATSQQSSANPTEGILLTNRNRQRTKPVPIATVVRALQQKTRSLEEVVAVLWRSDVAHRTAAAIVIQRYMRGALARMHLSEDDAESCRFIRYQLQQAVMAQKASAAVAAAAHAASLSRGPSARTATAHGARQPSIEPIEASGSNMAEVLVSMRSLQEVMSSMFVDLEEYRAMADREQRRAAVLIQRWYRGYRARRDSDHVRHHVGSPSSSRSIVSSGCKCAGKTAALQREVAELRHEVRELRELLTQSTRQQRLAAYEDPEKAMDNIVRKHEARVSEDRNQAKNTYTSNNSRSPSATPSITAADVGTSQERGLYHSTPRGDSHQSTGAKDDVVAAASKSPSQPRVQLHRMPLDLSSRISHSGATLSPVSTSPGAQAKKPSKITKRRPDDFTLTPPPSSPQDGSAASN